jgi:hypothetical protein
VPAAAVIPAPIAYIKIVAVKKLVVGSRFILCGPPYGGYFTIESLDGFKCDFGHIFDDSLNRVSLKTQSVYFEQIRVLKAGRLF